MKIYCHRMDLKFTGFPGENKDPVNAGDLLRLELPGLLICHADGQRQVEELCAAREKTQALAKGLAILFLGTEPFDRPQGITTSRVHCLSYGILSPCADTRRREQFLALVREGERRIVWREDEMSTLWATVEQEPLPETLLAWYLVEVARSRGTDLDPGTLSADFEVTAGEEFRKYGGQGKLDLAQTKAILAKAYSRERS